VKLHIHDGKAVLYYDGEETVVETIQDVVLALGGEVVGGDPLLVEIHYDDASLSDGCPLDSKFGDIWDKVKIYHCSSLNFGDRGVSLRDDSHDEESLEKEYPDREVFPLYMLSHPGTQLGLCPFSCPWDSGQIGFLVAPDRRTAEGAVELLNHWLLGECYMVVIRDSTGERLEICGGFWGPDDEKSGLMEYVRSKCPGGNFEILRIH
jgi:hypothetical protein